MAAPATLTTDPLALERIRALHVSQIRLNFMYSRPADPMSPIVCAAQGCHGYEGDAPADPYVDAVRAAGAEPLAVMILSTEDLSLARTNAARMVSHFNSLAPAEKRIGRWVVDNEPDLPGHGGVGPMDRPAMSGPEYSTYYNAVAEAAKTADPSILLGGPAAYTLDLPFISSFFAGSASQIDFVEHHKYADYQGQKSAAQVMAETVQYGDEIRMLRELLRQHVGARADRIPIELGEWNIDADPPIGDPRLNGSFASAWGASVLIHVLKAGGQALAFAIKDGAAELEISGDLGLLSDGGNSKTGLLNDDPMPLYHGIGMFTGEGLFRGIGSRIVSATSDVPHVEVLATGDQESLVVVNKQDAQPYAVDLELPGLSGRSIEVWLKDGTQTPRAQPVLMKTVILEEPRLSIVLPPYSVATLVVS